MKTYRKNIPIDSKNKWALNLFIPCSFSLIQKQGIGSDSEEEIKVTGAREMSLEGIVVVKACVRAGGWWNGDEKCFSCRYGLLK